eukprot:TRINITY_DN13342_c0_g3_i1.p1 TRINITY_DN13342_c0_g3~~TRINITY_DN13342_c0_g3_i1.p1  ORF type:complete len:497 (+),score=157.68 TRINITY_DN13342_c0_g3_i1:312-1802(+)
MRNDKEHDEEQVDLEGDEEPEEMEEEAEDEGYGDEEERNDVQDGLDLDVAEDEGTGSQDEQGEQNGNVANPYPDDPSFEDYRNNDTVEDTPAEGNNENLSKDDPSAEDLLARPPHGTEIFIVNFPRDTSKEDLRALCEQCGEVYEVNIKKEANKQDYAFVTFMSRESAKKAIETLNGHEFRERKLRISESQPKNRLFLGNIPSNWNEEDLTKTVSEQGPGFQRLELIKDPKDSSRNRGFAFVEYYNKGCAEKAMKNMTQSKFKLDDKLITVKWASAQRTSSEEVKSVYVRNLPENVTEEQLRDLFKQHGEITKIVLMDQKPGQPKRDYGFVHFAEHSSAVKAAEKSEKYELDGKELSVSLARPMSEKKPQNIVNPPYQRSMFGNFPSHGGFGYGPNMYRGMGSGFGASGYSQPVIYGRGPTPEGMMMVPMMLPDGRIGYVLQQPGSMPRGPPPYGSETSGRHRDRSGRSSRSSSGSSRHGGSRSSNSGSRSRYHPY